MKQPSVVILAWEFEHLLNGVEGAKPLKFVGFEGFKVLSAHKTRKQQPFYFLFLKIWEYFKKGEKPKKEMC